MAARAFLPRLVLSRQLSSRSANALHYKRTDSSKLIMSSPGVLSEPYHPKMANPSVPSLFSIEGLKFRRERLRRQFRNSAALALLKRKFPKTTPDTLVTEFEQIYAKFNKAMLSFDKNDIKDVATDSILQAVKFLTKNRENKKDYISNLMVMSIEPKTMCLQYRAVRLDRMNAEKSFIQVAARIKSICIPASFDSSGKIIKPQGDYGWLKVETEDKKVYYWNVVTNETRWEKPSEMEIIRSTKFVQNTSSSIPDVYPIKEKLIAVEDYVTFERSLFQNTFGWRICSIIRTNPAQPPRSVFSPEIILEPPKKK